jgi:hypothetical protein
VLSQRQTTAITAATLSSFAMAACGSSKSNRQPTGGHASPAARTVPARHPSQPRVGATQRIHAGGTNLSVTVTRVIEPLAGSGAALQPGTEAVGVLVRIQNHGPGIYDSSATGDISIEPTSGTATSAFASRGVCRTPLRDFDNYITAGEVRHGCVAFSIQTGAKVLEVHFSPHGQAAGRASWAG